MTDRPMHITGLDVCGDFLPHCGADATQVIDPAGRGTDPARQELAAWLCETCDWVHAQPDPEVNWLCAATSGAYPLPGALKGRVVALNPTTLRRASDKYISAERWREHGVVKDAVTLEYRSLPAPLFSGLTVHTGRAWIRSRFGAGSHAATAVTTYREAQAWVEYWSGPSVPRRVMKEDFIVAPWLPGPEFAVQTIWWQGRLVQTQARERVSHFFAAQSVSGQTSTPSVARTASRSDVYETAHAAVTALDASPHGVYCVDLRCDWRDRPVPTEVNYGRFFTTMDFLASVGVNGPACLLALHLKESPPRQIGSAPAGSWWYRGLDMTPKLVRGAA